MRLCLGFLYVHDYVRDGLMRALLSRIFGGKALRPSAEQDSVPFWKRKKLSEMSEQEWESVCDGCGLCCLVKFEEDQADGSTWLYPTRVACRLFDGNSCRCKSYANRQELVSDCIKVTPKNIGKLWWLPPSCGYRKLWRGEDLEWWHPLLSGSRETVFEAGIGRRANDYLSEANVRDSTPYVLRDRAYRGEPKPEKNRALLSWWKKLRPQF